MNSNAPEPKKNKLLATLPPVEYERLAPHLECMSLDTGALLPTSSSTGRLLYFPVDCAVSVLQADEDELSEVAITGNEGAIGISLVLLGESALNRSTVLVAGHAYRLQADILSRDFPLDSHLRQALFNYSLVLITQMGQHAYCRNHHSTQQRLVRWLLTIADYTELMPLRINQKLIAEIMSIEASQVQKIAEELPLQDYGLEIDRHHLVLTDRQLLLKNVCACYDLLRTKTSPWLAY